jgi:hypothetical protein
MQFFGKPKFWFQVMQIYITKQVMKKKISLAREPNRQVEPSVDCTSPPSRRYLTGAGHQAAMDTANIARATFPTTPTADSTPPINGRCSHRCGPQNPSYPPICHPVFASLRPVGAAGNLSQGAAARGRRQRKGRKGQLARPDSKS